MSGHSKWHKIRHKKQANDAKKGKVFTKLGKAITIAASEGGGDPEMNFSLRLAVDKAKEANMPSDNIERAIKKGTGELDGGQLTRTSYEAYAPSSVGVIIDTTTDNANRTIADVRKEVESHGGKMADSGSVSWQFTEKGLIIVRPQKLQKAEKYGAEDTYEDADKEDIMMELLEIDGIEDIRQAVHEYEKTGENSTFDVIEIETSKNDFTNVVKKVKELELKIISSDLVKMPNDPQDLRNDKQAQIERFVEVLEELDDVDDVWTSVG